jgi:thiol-disulfide isomerase/thioredoxin
VKCRLYGKIICEELIQSGKDIGWTNVYLLRNGERVGKSDSFSGEYQFLAEPGKYSLYAYGKLLQRRTIEIDLPSGHAEYEAPPIYLNASRLVHLIGHPAPDPAGILGWRGRPVRLADLRGDAVLIEFWGYWCGPCIHAMPILIDLHDKFAGNGVAILTVHVDNDGDVDSAARLDEKTAEIKKSLWGGRDLPFPTALSAGRTTPAGYTGITAGQYGILSFPTTILIDRKGKVVGQFEEARDFNAASAAIEKLLGANP